MPARSKEPPVLDEVSRVTLQDEYETHQKRMRFLEWLLGIKPTSVVLCPNCQKKFNRRDP